MIRYPRYILGVDPGTIGLGWCLVEFSKPTTFTAVGFGTILARDGDPLHRRFGTMLDGLSPVIAKAKELFAECVVERPFVNENHMATLAIAGSRAIALALIGLASMRFAEYMPNVWKAHVVGDGRATPEKYSYVIPQLLKLAGRMPFDAAAAAGLAIYHGTRPTPEI